MASTKDTQVRKLMKYLSQDNNLSKGAMRVGLDRKTARKYRDGGKLPSQLPPPAHDWRTRENPFERDWAQIEALLKETPRLEAKALFEHVCDGHERRRQELLDEGQHEEAEAVPRYAPGQLRTLQRHIKQWRAAHGPDKTVFFPQLHRPGEAMQTDFTVMDSFGITLGGEPFPHMLCHCVLPFSNWRWATVCLSESLLALRLGVQAAVFRLGKVPRYHQTDHSTAATHAVPDGRQFNDDYEAFIHHLYMEPRTTAVGQKEQNGDIEASNNAIKRRVTQQLLLRASADFADLAAYQAWLVEVMTRANAGCIDKLQQELDEMRVLDVRRLPEWTELDVKVAAWSTVRVKANAYSVPSRLIGERVRVRLYEMHIEIWYGGSRQLTVSRLLGHGGGQINYRHIIASLLRKPGAFARYRYREALFPSLVFRRTYDHLLTQQPERQAELEYLRILHLAATTSEQDVEAALSSLLDEGQLKDVEQVKALCGGAEPALVPEVSVPIVDLSAYDALLCGEVTR